MTKIFFIVNKNGVIWPAAFYKSVDAHKEIMALADRKLRGYTVKEAMLPEVFNQQFCYVRVYHGPNADKSSYTEYSSTIYAFTNDAQNDPLWAHAQEWWQKNKWKPHLFSDTKIASSHMGFIGNFGTLDPNAFVAEIMYGKVY